MSFSTKVKEEIRKHESHARHCMIAELLALVLATGEVEFKKEEVRLKLRPDNDIIGDKICRLMDVLFDKMVLCERHGRYIAINDSNMSEMVLQTLKLSDYIELMSEDWLDDDEISERLVDSDTVYVSSHGVSLQNCHFPRQVIQKSCCKKAFIRGFFLASGSVNDPNKAYHLEIVADTKDMADVIRGLMASFSLDAKVVKRKKYYVVYLKDGSMIVDMLNIMEAYVSLMDMENVRIIKDMRNDINRRVNCETSNIRKTVSAAMKQIADIEYIEKTKGLKYLSPSLREIAQVRLAEPDADLATLGTMVNPPISKSGVNHRLRKISKIVEEMKNGK